MQPKYLTREDVPADVLEREKAILKEKALNEGKKAEMLDKIVLGQLVKFYQDVVLLDQSWVRDDKLSVDKYLKQNGVVVTAFERFKAGQQDEQAAAATETKAE
jgi:elongation factor Ts